MKQCFTVTEPHEWKTKSFPVYMRQKDRKYVKRNFNVLHRLTLLKISEQIINKTVIPKCWHWTEDEVLNWLENDLDLPRYKAAFSVNHITGRKLIILDSRALTKMNIKDYNHIKKILSEIKCLYGLLPEKHPRSLSLPRLHFLHHFYKEKAKTGPHYDQLTYHRYMEDSKLEHAIEPDNCYFHKHRMDNAWQLPFLLGRDYPLYQPSRIFLKNQDIRGPPPLDRFKYNTLGNLSW